MDNPIFIRVGTTTITPGMHVALDIREQGFSISKIVNLLRLSASSVQISYNTPSDLGDAFEKQLAALQVEGEELRLEDKPTWPGVKSAGVVTVYRITCVATKTKG